MLATRYTASVALFLGLANSLAGCAVSTAPSSSSSGRQAALPKVTLLNVSYDPTREFYQEFNASFTAYWREKTGQEVTIDQSHGGSGKQARAVIDGLEADVITLALAYDVNAVATRGQLLAADWQQRLPHNSAPYTSTIVFLVRKGNPKQIKDWDDLVKGDIAIITPNPKTSGGARWNYLAAWGYVLKRELGDWAAVSDPAKAEQVTAANAKAQEFVNALFKRVAVLDSGARGSTNTFVQREIGDVLLAWENEAFLAVKDLGSEKFEIVVPSVSIRAEPPVAAVDKYVEKHGTREIAEAYLQHLYSPQGQQLAAKHFYRPAVTELVSEDQRRQFTQVELFTIDAVFGGWDKAQATHFDDGGVFDQIYQPGKS
jgi:sulfate transport system substrate-binding protein